MPGLQGHYQNIMPPSLCSAYPWTRTPLIASAPMRLIAFAPLAVAVSKAGGIGFIAAGAELKDDLRKAANLIEESPIQGAERQLLPVGIGFIVWNANLHSALATLEEYTPAAVWLFAPHRNADLKSWTEGIRRVTTNRTKIWIQIGTVSDALELAKMCRPEVLVVQGNDAGGHGLAQGASNMTLLPEVSDALREAKLENISLVAAGGIIEGRGAAACFVLGANGVVLGTRFLASKEATIAKGYQDDVLRAKDGGTSTARTNVYDTLRGTTGWPARYNGRGIINRSFLDAQGGKSTDENKLLYEEALKKGDQGWGEDGRLTAYAGSGVGLVKEVSPAQGIIDEVIHDVLRLLPRPFGSLSKL